MPLIALQKNNLKARKMYGFSSLWTNSDPLDLFSCCCFQEVSKCFGQYSLKLLLAFRCRNALLYLEYTTEILHENHPRSNNTNRTWFSFSFLISCLHEWWINYRWELIRKHALQGGTSDAIKKLTALKRSKLWMLGFWDATMKDNTGLPSLTRAPMVSLKCPCQHSPVILCEYKMQERIKYQRCLITESQNW